MTEEKSNFTIMITFPNFHLNMNKLCYLTIMFFGCRVCEGQNLVPNWSFEDTVQCPDDLAQVDRATGWFASSGTSDYFNSCFIYQGGLWNVDVPANSFGYQYAKTGDGYVGMATFYQGIREAVGIQLINPLQIGTKYYVSFYVSLGNSISSCAANKTGICFSSTKYLWTFSNMNAVPILNQSKVYTDSIITDTLNWVKIKGSFISDSNYTYLYVGNFFADSLTNFIQLNPPYCVAYYIIDDVCVSTDSLTCNPPVGINEIKNQEKLILFPNPFSDELNITTKRNEPVEITLFDITSRKLLQQSFTNSISINTSHLSKGIYIYELRNKIGVIKKGKVLKN